jgi:type IV pilus assembly protein PilM
MGLRAVAAAVEPLETGAIVDGAIHDRNAVSSAVRRACERGAFARSVCLGLPGSVAIVRRVRVPDVADAERDEAIRWEAAQQIPFDIGDVYLDYQEVRPAEGDEQGATDVLVAAAKKETVADYTDAVAGAGRLPVVVDLNPLAFQNAYAANYGTSAEEVVALLDAGASAVSVNVVRRGEWVFARDIQTGGNRYTEALQRELGLSFEDAERAKRGASGAAPFEQVRPVLRAVTEQILLEISKTFGFLQSTSFSPSFTRIVVTGGASRIAEFSSMVEERFNTPVVEFDPFRTVAWDVPSAPDVRPQLAPCMAVAVGLALRHPGDTGARGVQR